MNKWVEVAPLTYVRHFHDDVLHVIRPDHPAGAGFQAMATDGRNQIVIGTESTVARAAELIDKAMEMMS